MVEHQYLFLLYLHTKREAVWLREITHKKTTHVIRAEINLPSRNSTGIAQNNLGDAIAPHTRTKEDCSLANHTGDPNTK